MRSAMMLSVLLALIGCSGAPVVPVSDLTATRSPYAARVVREGDTLYTIAWEAGLDYRDVARWNNLEPPYALKVGQRIALGGASNKVTPAPELVQTAPSEATTVQTEEVVVSETPTATTPVAPSADQSLPKRVQTTHGWIWPAEGELIARFDEERNSNGIDIAGIDGTPVRAAAAGKVVYAGTGLRGYGLLLIIKHDETYLSAYAHNRAVTVEEGDLIDKGQIIAEMGQTGTDSVRLHFEIRRDGQPVNPLSYLPPN